MKNKKNLIILVIIIGVLIILSVIATIWARNQQKKKQQMPILSQGNTIQTVEAIGETIYFPGLTNGLSINFLGDKGIKFKSFNLKKQNIENLYADDIYFIQKVKYSTDGQKAILLIQKEDNYYYETINFMQKSTKIITGQVSDVSWLDNENIIYAISDNQKTVLEKSTWDGQNKEKIIDLPIDSLFIQVSHDSKKIAFYPPTEGYGENPLYIYFFDSNKIQQMPKKFNLVGAVWSPDSQKIASQSFNSNGNTLGIVVTNVSSKKQQNIKNSYFSIENLVWLDNDNFLTTANNQNKDDQLFLVKPEVNKTADLEINFNNPEPTVPLKIENLMLKDKTLFFTSNDLLYKVSL